MNVPPTAAAVAGKGMAVAFATAAAASKGKEKVVISKGKEKIGVSIPKPPPQVTSGRFMAYPARMAEHRDVVADASLFRAALEKLHTYMCTRFRVPIIGGKDLDLHQLYKEVTARGGVDKVTTENRWREVKLTFAFPATATNASFILKKYYMSLLYHFEQLYFFKIQGCHQQEADSKSISSFEVKTEAQVSRKRKMDTACLSEPTSSSDDVDVDVIIDSKFEHGYIVTVVMGSTSTKAVLYNCTEEPAQQTPLPPIVSNDTDMKGGHRRKKKKLSSTDPRHPKLNRSGYTFFFQDQHRLLKPQYPGQDRLISKTIGERWSNLSSEEKAVYQERGVQDKERYRTQLAAYKEERRTAQPISDVVPIRQRHSQTEVTIEEVDTKVREGNLLLCNQWYSGSDGSDHSGERTIEDEELNTDTALEMSMETADSSGQPDTSASVDADCFELRRRENTKTDEKQNDPPDA